ncbi:MAG TPA: RNA polymerase sigma factor [Rhizomicrobium sp.]
MAPISKERAQWLARHVLPHEAALRAWLRGKSTLGFEADDVVQETYTILATKADIDTIRNPKAYMFQVAYSVILQQLRHARVVPITAVADFAGLEAVLDAPSPEQAVVARQELAILMRAIEAMPRQTRQAFILRRIEGLSQAQIARHMRLSEHTVEKHIARGIKLLLAQFGHGGNASLAASMKETEPETRDDPKANCRIH